MRLVSLDIVSLFTNVPVDLALQVLHHRWTEIAEHTSINRDDFLQAVKFVLEANIFSFNGVFYKQVFGTAMGSPISPVIANLVMERLGTISLSKVPFQLKFYKRYVDDIITCIKLEDLPILLDTFNSFHNRLQFTYQVEKDSCLSFLATLVIRSDNKLTTNWYHKPSWSGRYINFFSVHPMQHKGSNRPGDNRRQLCRQRLPRVACRLAGMHRLVSSDFYRAAGIQRLVTGDSATCVPHLMTETLQRPSQTLFSSHGSFNRYGCWCRVDCHSIDQKKKALVEKDVFEKWRTLW